jgi:hypothetical protein
LENATDFFFKPWNFLFFSAENFARPLHCDLLQCRQLFAAHQPERATL